jgi:hypothetical protein
MAIRAFNQGKQGYKGIKGKQGYKGKKATGLESEKG